MTRRTSGFETPGHAHKGGGRTGSKRSAGKRCTLRPALSGISKAGLKRLARRAGVIRIAADCLDAGHTGSIPMALDAFLRRVLVRVAAVADHARRFTVIPNDVAFALKQMGITLYREGADWTYGFYTRTYVRQRLARPLPRALLEQAAAARADSQVASAAACSPAANRAARTAATPAAVAAPPAARELEEEGEEVVSAATSTAAQPAAAAAEQPELQETGTAVAAPAEEQEAGTAAASPAEEEAAALDGLQAPTAAQEPQLLSPAVQQPFATGKAAGPEADAAAAAEGADRPPCGPPTPDGPLSEERARELQAWMSEVMQGPLCQQGFVNKHDLQKMMLLRHTCSAGEVGDLLFAMERDGRIMEDDGSIYLCS